MPDVGEYQRWHAWYLTSRASNPMSTMATAFLTHIVDPGDVGVDWKALHRVLDWQVTEEEAHVR